MEKRPHDKITKEKVAKADKDENHLLIPICSCEMRWEQINFIDDEITADSIKDRDENHRNIKICTWYVSSSLQCQTAPCDHAGDRKDEVSRISDSETGEEIESNRSHDKQACDE